MPREPFIEERVVRGPQVQRISVLTKLAFDEQFGFASESSAQFVVEFGEERVVTLHGCQLIEREPGVKESGDQCGGLGVGKHPPDLCLQGLGIVQSAPELRHRGVADQARRSKSVLRDAAQAPYRSTGPWWLLRHDPECWSMQRSWTRRFCCRASGQPLEASCERAAAEQLAPMSQGLRGPIGIELVQREATWRGLTAVAGYAVRLDRWPMARRDGVLGRIAAGIEANAIPKIKIRSTCTSFTSLMVRENSREWVHCHHGSVCRT